MARRPFDPGERGWKKTEYRQGDVTDAASVRELVKGADVVVHLAFAILDASDATRELNVEGSRRVFEEAAKAGAERICYASSVAAYGFHDDNPDWLTEDIPPRGSPEHPVLAPEGRGGARAGRGAAAPARTRWPTRSGPASSPARRRARCSRRSPTSGSSEAMPDAVARLLGSLPVLKPVIPDPGHPLPARARGRRGERVRGRACAASASRGPYNLAGGGTLTMSDLADALGWYSVPVPKPLVEATAEIATRLPLMPEQVAWIHSVKKPVLMKTDRAKKQLRWRPEAHRARPRSRRWRDAQRAARYSSA